MAIYTGKITDASFRAIGWTGLSLTARTETSSGDVSTAGRLIVTREVPVALEEDGSFSVNLIASDDIVGTPRYIVTATYLDNFGQYSRRDMFRFYARRSGGLIAQESIDNMPTTQFTWVGINPPPSPIPWTSWLNPVTGEYKEWEAK